MATYSGFDSPTFSNPAAHYNAEEAPSRTASGLSSSRQTRKLQLRNAGFRGGALPARKVTPKSMTSSNWSSISGACDSSDIENVSPVALRDCLPAVAKRQTSGILQDIGNSTITHRPKKERQRLTLNKAFDPDATNGDVTDPSLPDSPPLSRPAIRQRSVRSKPKVSHRRRSLSAETSKYIEHLEAELANTQTQLSSITSPSIARENSSRMRNLNTETRQLQEELSEWEAKYEDRVQEQVDRHVSIETDLRARIRNLEQDAEDSRFRIQGLESQLETTAENMQAVETANVNLEKRLEIMSELLASTKIDLHVETPGRAIKHVRPKSMLPRFPTASSLIGSPERQTHTQPTSPLAHTTNYSGFLDSAIQNFSPVNSSVDDTDAISEAESVFSEHSTACDSMTSAENFESQPSFNPWNLPAPQQSLKAKPARRMRRFGAGSVGPKPLILPTASQRGQYAPATAPPLEHSKTTPIFFPARPVTFEDAGSPVSGRRRASTTANEMSIPDVEAYPSLDLPEHELGEDSLISLATPQSVGSNVTTRRYSSIGEVTGRNLMEELSAARSIKANSANDSSEGNSADDHPADSDRCQRDSDTDEGFEIMSPAAESGPSSSSRTITESTPPSTTTSSHRRTRSRSVSIPIRCSESAFSRLRILFGDLWRSPVAIARYFIQTAQTRLRIPRPLLNVQWWLVGVLLGPMAKRRMLASGRHPGLENTPLLLEGGRRRDQEEDGLAYGTVQRVSSTSSGHGLTDIANKKRASRRMYCVHRQSKHSPWLWIKFSITLAFAIGVAFKDGPGSLLMTTACRCVRRRQRENAEASEW